MPISPVEEAYCAGLKKPVPVLKPVLIVPLLKVKIEMYTQTLYSFSHNIFSNRLD